MTYEQANEGDGWGHCPPDQPCCWLKAGTAKPWAVRPASNGAKSAVVRPVLSAGVYGAFCTTKVHTSGPRCKTAWNATSDEFTAPARPMTMESDATTITTTTTILRAPGSVVGADGRAVGLQLLVEARRYSDFPGSLEYASRIQLAGALPTHVCDLADVDWLLPVDPAEEVVLFSQSGSSRRGTVESVCTLPLLAVQGIPTEWHQRNAQSDPGALASRLVRPAHRLRAQRTLPFSRFETPGAALGFNKKKLYITVNLYGEHFPGPHNIRGGRNRARRRPSPSRLAARPTPAPTAAAPPTARCRPSACASARRLASCGWSAGPETGSRISGATARASGSGSHPPPLRC